MTTKAKNDKDFFKNFRVKNQLMSGGDDTVVVKFRNSGEPFLLR